jgi:hypothetical protein
MLVLAASRAFQMLVKTQIWIALCAWAATASCYCVVENALLPWQWGVFVALIVLSAYSWYYVTNPEYPNARSIALVSSLLCITAYALLDYPKPTLSFVLVLLSLLYMLPIKEKNTSKILFRWILLSLIWTLFTFYFPLRFFHYSLNTAVLFTYRLLFMGNLCFIFLIKDDFNRFQEEHILFIRHLLLGAQGVAILSIGYLFSWILASVLCIPFLLLILFYKKQTPYSGLPFYSLGIDGLMILESIFVHSLFIYGKEHCFVF